MVTLETRVNHGAPRTDLFPFQKVGFIRMLIGDRLRELREEKKMSQGDIERETGLLRCYISRVENGYTVPALETLEKFARALQVPMYRLFYDGDELPKVPRTKTTVKTEWGSEGEDARLFAKLRDCLGRMSERDRTLLLHILKRMTMNGRNR